jgi:glycine/D-amino acid oxidase-like deaminating enzyme
MNLEAMIPPGAIQDAWDNHRFGVRLVNASNKRRFSIIVVGTGLAGASAAATLAELGYQVKAFTFHDSPRRAHSIAAQGGINAAKDYRNDGDSVFRLFYDTIKGGDFRSREANVYRLAQVSNEIIDQATAQGVPFAREYGGLLDNRSLAGAQVSRTFYARGQTGQQLLLGAYQAMSRQVAAGKVELYTRTEMLDVVVHGGRAVGIVVRDLLTGEVSSHSAHAVVLATGGLLERLLPLHEREGVQRDGDLARAPQGRRLREPLLHADPPDLHPAVGRDAVEADADERVAAQRRAHLGARRRRARLLPGAPLSRLREPRAARRGKSRGEGDDRRGPRRGAAAQRRLPRLRGRDRAARRADHPRALREPLPDV